MSGYGDPLEHLLAELSWLDLLLARRVAWLRKTGRFTEDPFRGLYVAEGQVDASLAPEAEAIGESAGEAATRRALIDRDAAAAEGSGMILPLRRLRRLFGLDDFEQASLLLAAAPDIELRYETLFAYAQNDVTRKRPTVDLALALFAGDRHEQLQRRQSFAEDAPLIRNRLVSLAAKDEPDSFLARRLTSDRRIVDALLGGNRLDERLTTFTTLVTAPAAGELKERLVRAALLWRSAPTLLHFEGPPDAGQRAAAEALAAREQSSLLVVEPLAESHLLAGILAREAVLQNAAVFVELPREIDGAEARRLALLLDGLCAAGRLVMAAGGPDFAPQEHLPHLRSLSFPFEAPTFAERLAHWQRALSAGGLNGAAAPLGEALAVKFGLGPAAVEAAVEAAEWDAALDGGGTLDASRLHRAARAGARHSLARLARKIEPCQDWSDLVLPARELQQLREICGSVTHWPLVHRRWGFDAKLPYGRALAVLFSGRSGTGKTMAASIIARTLDLDIYKIDLATVVSKYIGETEKNLDRIFCEGEASNAVLFFDEADALFGKRSEVKDAHDRYANLEVAYLLQRIEAYEGLVILATNLAKNIDEAFARRMRHVVEFPFPDAGQRERIWRTIFPAAVPLSADVDLAFLATRFEIAGGSIRNVALAGAFLAAEDGTPIGMAHLARAMAREMQKLGRMPARAEFGGYYDLI
ncbi:MAG TPA: ATP-binding protein, partial [Dongiaceae bacterium]|nr:ATP-binding protein [Dongiaceae bacterium]